MTRYEPKKIEPKWQKVWEEQGVYKVDFDSSKPKFVGFGMFNYPSGAGIHVGHVRNFTIPDVVTRVKRQQGFESYQPVGWDSFGLPAENYAIKTGVPPQLSTKTAIAKYRDQYRAMGWAVDWTKEINTTDPGYYKWTQWCFAKLFEHGLAYQKESAQWWCEFDKTVLADEQVEAGKCWRCGNPVVKKSLKQWFFKITEYADEMLEATDDLDWTPSVKASQKSWIGRSMGAEVNFALQGIQKSIKVFTTRIDTIFGATFLVLAPEHPLVPEITSKEHKQVVDEYIKKTLQKTEVQRQQEADEKSGVFTGAFALNPANDKKIPVWISDFILGGYGTGAIFGDAHDARDVEFAKKYDIPLIPVVAPMHGQEQGDEKHKQSVVVVLRRPEDGKVLVLDWGPRHDRWGGHMLIGGTIDGDESPEKTAEREIVEETGYQNFKLVKKSQTPGYGYFYSNTKHHNVFTTTTGLIYELTDSKQGNPKLEKGEKNKFKLVWQTPEKTGELLDDGIHEFYLRDLALEEAFMGEGKLFNSGKYDGLETSEAREKILVDLESKQLAKEKTNYKMRDWLISRQRYWGAPIPIIHCEKDGAVAVPEKDLPVKLPEIANYQPTGGKTSVLAGVESWVNTTCPKCEGPAKRETDTMDGYICSSWYFLRYLDPANDKQAWNPEQAGRWMPIDFYNGADHATAHLLYARFFTRFFHKIGLINTPEPFKKMVFNGKIKAHDGSAFSKSKGNGIDPLEVIEQGYGADSIRLYEMFAAPVELDVLWDPRGIPGSYRFLNRIWTLAQAFIEAKKAETPAKAEEKLQRIIHTTIKKVTKDVQENHFNTAIAAMMEAVNTLYKIQETDGLQQSVAWRFGLESLLQLVAPFAPHLSEELWQQLGHKDTIHTDHWPKWDETFLITKMMTIAVQVNGKLRGQVIVEAGANEETVTKAALKDPKIKTHLESKPKKTIFVPGKIINFVV